MIGWRHPTTYGGHSTHAVKEVVSDRHKRADAAIGKETEARWDLARPSGFFRARSATITTGVNRFGPLSDR